MWLAALLFLSIGVGDLSRPRDDSRRPWRALIAAAVGTGTAAVAIGLANTPWPWLAVVAAVALAWNLASALLPERWTLLPVAVLVVAVAVSLAFPEAVPAPAGALATWFDALPYDALAATLFILWMAVAGQALAVSAIIAAKSILRFPEIRDSGKGSARGVLAEYVLVGSLVSWGLALIVVPLH